MPVLPGQLALTSPADGALAVAADIRNANTAIQTEANALLTILGAGTAGDVFTGVGTTVQYAKPPGYEYAYNEAAADVSITGTTSAAATSVLAGTAVTFDGATIIEIEFYCAALTKGTTNIQVGLYDGATYLANLFYLDVASNLPAGKAARRLTPSAGAHTYNVKAFVDAGTGVVRGTGTGGLPMFLRITKV